MSGAQGQERPAAYPRAGRSATAGTGGAERRLTAAEHSPVTGNPLGLYAGLPRAIAPAEPDREGPRTAPAPAEPT